MDKKTFIALSDKAREDLSWWMTHLRENLSSPLVRRNPNITIKRSAQEYRREMEETSGLQ